MKYLKPINEFWGDVLKRGLLGETRQEDKFHSQKELREYIDSEIEKQGDNVVIQNLDVSLIEDLSDLFEDFDDRVKTLDLSGWKTSNVWSMSYMFYDCKNLESLNLSGWDTSSVEIMIGMFHQCESLKSLDLSDWNTSKVNNMEGMFYGCENLKTLDLSGWDTSNVEDMICMFDECPAPYEVINNKIVRK